MKVQTFDQSLKKYSGRNNFSENTNLDATQFRVIQNWDLFNGIEEDYFRTRRGSVRLVPESEPAKQLGQILNKVVFPVNGEEYLICAYIPDPDEPTIAFSSQPLLAIGNPTRIKTSAWEISGASFLSKLALFGVDKVNSNGVTLYWSFDSGTGDFKIYSDEDMTTLIAFSNSLIDDQTNLIEQQDGSGITGTIYAGTLGDDETGTIQLADTDIEYSIDQIPDMKVFNNRVFVFQQSGNLVIEWNSGLAEMLIRPLGLPLPVIESWSSSDDIGDGGSIDPNGAYYYGLEFVVQKNGVDVVASTPNRKYANGAIQQVFPIAGNSQLQLLTSVLDANVIWTHLRLWRTKNLIPNFTDPLFPINAQGVIGQLYEVALITRAEIYGTFGPVATSSDLPAGNALVEAGLAFGNYFINDKNGDDVLSFLVGLDLIELVQIPGCRTGDMSNGKVFCSGVGSEFVAPNAPMVDPSIVDDVLYTTTQFSEYQEQWDPQAYLNAGRDGKKTAAIITFVQDVIVIREGMTKRIQGANPDAGVVMVDDKIGIPTFRMAGYIPGIGICAICSDKYFRYLSFGLVWNQNLGATEISQSIYDLTSAQFSAQIADFAYSNGKLLMLLPVQGIAALHVKEGKGWTVYSYPHFIDTLFSFANRQRTGCASESQYLIEIEDAGIVDEESEDVDGADHAIVAPFETYGFSGKGKLLEPTRYSFWGKLSSNAVVTAKVSGQTWDMRGTFQDPGLYSATPELNEREYRFEPKPQDIGIFKWVPLRGQFVSFSVSTVAPAMVSWQKLVGKIRATFGNQQATLAGGIAPQGPGWANQSLMVLNFEDPDSIFYDASGKGLNHTWFTNGGSKSNRVSQKPGKGVQVLAGGYLNYPTDPVHSLFGAKNIAWKTVFSIPSGGKFEAFGKLSGAVWQLVANEDGLIFRLNDDYTWTSEVELIAGKVYALTFALGKNYVGQFYVDALDASEFAGKRETVREDDATIPPAPLVTGSGSAKLSGIAITSGWNYSTLYGRIYDADGVFNLALWNNSAGRDVLDLSTALAAGGGDYGDQPILTTFSPLFAPSSLNGSVTVHGLSNPTPNIDFEVFSILSVTGHTLYPVGIVSFYTIETSDPKVEQAARFWGMMKAYP